jgi:hypothetical protein
VKNKNIDFIFDSASMKMDDILALAMLEATQPQ